MTGAIRAAGQRPPDRAGTSGSPHDRAAGTAMTHASVASPPNRSQPRRQPGGEGTAASRAPAPETTIPAPIPAEEMLSRTAERRTDPGGLTCATSAAPAMKLTAPVTPAAVLSANNIGEPVVAAVASKARADRHVERTNACLAPHSRVSGPASTAPARYPAEFAVLSAPATVNDQCRLVRIGASSNA